MKTCNVCRVEKSATEFHRDRTRRDGLSNKCRDCNKALAHAWYVANRTRAAEQQRAYHLENRELRIAAMRARYAADPEHFREQARLRLQENPEKVRASARASKRKNYAADPAKVLARIKARRLAKAQRVPPWADLDAITAVYRKAAEIAALTGEPVHVDHEIPLRGKLVSGLHVANNLVIRHATENLRKSNRFEVA